MLKIQSVPGTYGGCFDCQPVKAIQRIADKVGIRFLATPRNNFSFKKAHHHNRIKHHTCWLLCHECLKALSHQFLQLLCDADSQPAVGLVAAFGGVCARHQVLDLVILEVCQLQPGAAASGQGLESVRRERGV